MVELYCIYISINSIYDLVEVTWQAILSVIGCIDDCSLKHSIIVIIRIYQKYNIQGVYSLIECHVSLEGHW